MAYQPDFMARTQIAKNGLTFNNNNNRIPVTICNIKFTTSGSNLKPEVNIYSYIYWASGEI